MNTTPIPAEYLEEKVGYLQTAVERLVRLGEDRVDQTEELRYIERLAQAVMDEAARWQTDIRISAAFANNTDWAER